MRRFRRCFFIAIAATFVSTSAYGNELTALKFKEICDAAKNVNAEELLCNSWINGYLSAQLVDRSTFNAAKENLGVIDRPLWMKMYSHCVPDRVWIDQSKAILYKYVAQHPEQLHLPISVVFYRALKDVFPCG